MHDLERSGILNSLIIYLEPHVEEELLDSKEESMDFAQREKKRAEFVEKELEKLRNDSEEWK